MGHDWGTDGEEATCALYCEGRIHGWVITHGVRQQGEYRCGHEATCIAEVRPGVFCWLCDECADVVEAMTDKQRHAISAAQNRRNIP